jgi:signal transduction histidine kinase
VTSSVQAITELNNKNVVFAFYACYRQYRRGEKQAALTLGLSLAIFVGTVQCDRLIDLGVFKSLYLSEYGFLSFVVIMSLRLRNELMQVIKLRKQLIESEQLRKIAVELEQNRLARDLHDSVSQTLFTVATIAEALPRVWQRNPEAAQQGLEEIAQMTQGALAEMRNLLIEMKLSPSTIRHHVSQVLNKLGVTNRTEAATTAVRVGCV